MAAVQNVIENQIIEAAKAVESQLDAELEKLEKLDIDDIDKLRDQRMKEMKRQAEQKRQWIAMGHGEYSEIPEEKEFFEVSKKSKNIVCHFYKSDSPRCKIVDHHLKILAPKHVEARFCKIDVERCPFLTERLRIKVIPTVALVKDSKTKDYIVGFTDLGNCDDFPTEMMEWRIAKSGAIDYQGDLLHPPDQQKKSKSLLNPKKTIRGKESDSDDDDDDDDGYR